MVDDVGERVVVAGAVCDGNRFLAARRTAPPEAAGRWELPGGKADPGEPPEEALIRELREELGIEVEPLRRIPGEYRLAPGLVLRAWQVRRRNGDPRPLQDHDQLRWLSPSTAYDVTWLEPDLPFVAELVRLLEDATQATPSASSSRHRGHSV